MARPKTLQALLDTLEPGVRAAFLAAMQNVRDDAVIADIIDALTKGDIERAIRAIPLGAEYLAPLDSALRQSHQDGGEWAMQSLQAMAKTQGVQVTARFNPRNLRAERFTAEQSARLVTEVLEETKAGLRALMVQQLKNNTAPRSAALDIVGRVNKLTGKRGGGLVGLHSQDIDLADRLKGMLSDPEQIRRFFIKDAATGKSRPRYKNTPKSFNTRIRAAIKAGRGLNASDLNGFTNIHRNNLLRNRGESIARTELLGSLSHAEDEGLEQLIERGTVGRDYVYSEWDSSEDQDTRDSHRAMDGQRRRQGEPFVTGDSFLMLFPGDRSLGAPAKEIIKCRCVRRIDIDFIGSAAAR